MSNSVALLSYQSLSKEPRPPLPTLSIPLFTQQSPPVPLSPAHTSATTTPFPSVPPPLPTARSPVAGTSGARAPSPRTAALARAVTSAGASGIPPVLPMLFIPGTHISSVSAALPSTLTLITVYAAT